MFSRGEIFVVWLIPVSVVILISFRSAFEYLSIARGFQWRFFIGGVAMLQGEILKHRIHTEWNRVGLIEPS